MFIIIYYRFKTNVNKFRRKKIITFINKSTLTPNTKKKKTTKRKIKIKWASVMYRLSMPKALMNRFVHNFC